VVSARRRLDENAGLERVRHPWNTSTEKDVRARISRSSGSRVPLGMTTL
jgi:hypothetical protein